jgi:hypothetical protein
VTLVKRLVAVVRQPFFSVHHNPYVVTNSFVTTKKRLVIPTDSYNVARPEQTGHQQPRLNLTRRLKEVKPVR